MGYVQIDVTKAIQVYVIKIFRHTTTRIPITELRRFPLMPIDGPIIHFDDTKQASGISEPFDPRSWKIESMILSSWEPIKDLTNMYNI